MRVAQRVCMVSVDSRGQCVSSLGSGLSRAGMLTEFMGLKGSGLFI